MDELEQYLRTHATGEVDLTPEDIKLAKKLWKKDKEGRKQLVDDANQVLFRMTPPTPLEYLDAKNGWLPAKFIDGLFDHVKEDFVNILDDKKKYTQVVEYGATRLGKSVLARLIVHYIIIYVHCLRNPASFYGLLEGTSLAVYIMSFVSGKTAQLLLSPIYKILRMSPRFKQVKFQDKVFEMQAKNGLETIYWSKANDDGGHITLESGLTLHMGTDFMSFIGSDLLFLVVSEINFFIEKAGATHEDIFKLYSEGLERIRATVGKNYLAMVYLDSSANDIENPIERYINHDLRKSSDVYFRQRSRWDCDNLDRREMKIWLETKETFPVFVGNGTLPARIVGDIRERGSYPPNLVYDVPIDVKQSFITDVNGAIKNIIGIPTIKENSFITDKTIIDRIFVPELVNVEGGIVIGAEEQPEGLVWNKLCDMYFAKIGIDHYAIKRAPKEPRIVHIDIAHSSKGCTYGFAMLHMEMDQELSLPVYVADMAFSFLPSDKGINLEAVQEFIKELRTKGNVPIMLVTSDTFQSATIMQNLERCDISTKILSLERSIDPYQFLYTLMLQDPSQIRMGRNIFVKNNLRGLIREKDNKGGEKINKSSGRYEYDYRGDWETSSIGATMKDASDCVAGAAHALKVHNILPTCIYQTENARTSKRKENMEETLKESYDMIHKYF